MAPKAKRAASMDLQEGQDRGNKRIKIEDMRGELEGSAEYATQMDFLNALTAQLGTTTFKSQAATFAFYATLVITLAGGLFFILPPVASFYSWVQAEKYKREAEQTKANIKRVQSADDSIIFRVKMLRTFERSPVLFFKHPKICNEYLETFFLGGRESFLILMRDVLERSISEFLEEDMQEITMRLVQDYHELGATFDSAIIAYLTEEEHDLDDLIDMCGDWRFTELIRPKLPLRQALDEAMQKVLSALTIEDDDVFAFLTTWDEDLDGAMVEKFKEFFPKTERVYNKVEKDFVKKLEQEARGSTMLSDIFREHEPEIFARRLHLKGVAGLLKTLLHNDVNFTPLGDIRKSSGWLFHLANPQLKLMDRNIQLFLDSNAQRLELLTQRSDALSGDDGLHFTTAIKARAKAELDEELASLQQEYASTIASPTRRKQELEDELTRLSSLTANSANQNKITRATQDLASVKYELENQKNLYNLKKQKTARKIEQKKEEDINRKLDSHKQEQSQAQRELQWEMKNIQSNWDLFKAVNMK